MLEAGSGMHNDVMRGYGTPSSSVTGLVKASILIALNQLAAKLPANLRKVTVRLPFRNKFLLHVTGNIYLETIEERIAAIRIGAISRADSTLYVMRAIVTQSHPPPAILTSRFCSCFEFERISRFCALLNNVTP